MIRGSSAPHARRRLRAWLFAVLAALPITAVLAATQYLYDDLGRLVVASNTDGSSTVYAYDENGNIVTIIRSGTSGPVIASFSPLFGHAGTAVQIFGTGFSATPANNTVTIGGVAATVSSATATTINSAIPQGASTGPITVTVGGETATSSQNITVYTPSISSFSPSLVAPGGSVTVTGANLNLVAGGTSLSVGGAAVTVTSLTDEQAVFTAPSNNTGGLITVNTSYGQATSATSLVIVPTAVGVANVVDHDPADPNGASQALAINQQNKVALLSFLATTNTYYSVQLDALTLTPSGGSINYTVYSPNHASFASGSVSTTAPSIHLPKTTAAGRYLVAFNSGSKTSVQITAKVELNAILTNGTTVPQSTTAASQSKRLVFDATAGDDVSVAITNLALTPNPPNSVNWIVIRPDGYQLVSYTHCFTTAPSGCTKDSNLNDAPLLNLPLTGTYSVIVAPNGAATMSLSMTFSQDVASALTTGTPLTVNLDQPGRQGFLTFTATAGQTVALRLSSLAMTPAGTGVTMRVYKSNGDIVGNFVNITTAATMNLPDLTAGTYSVFLAPQNAAIGTMDLLLINGVTGTLTNGSTQSFSTTLPSQAAYFTFTATAGDDVSLALTGLSLSPTPPTGVIWNVYRPDGYQLVSQTTCFTAATPGCTKDSNLNDAPLLNLPLTGTYKVVLSPQGAQTMSFNITFSQDVAGALTAGTPLTVNLDAPGRQGFPTFTATAGQTVALRLSSLAMTPAGAGVTFRVYKSNGEVIGNFVNVTASATMNLPDLTAGTYSVLLAPQNAATGSMDLLLVNGVTATLANGTTQSFSTTLPSQAAYFTFAATAGDDVSLAMTNLSLSPTPPTGINWYVIRPDGYQLVSNTTCYTANVPGCTKDSNLNDAPLLNLPVTGTYKVVVGPQGAQTMSFNMTFSQDVAGPLTAGTPLAVNFDSPGRQGFLTFTATAGQNVELNLGSLAMTPAGTGVAFRVYKSNGDLVGNFASVTSTATMNLQNLTAGTYSVFLAPRDAAMGTAQLTLANPAGGALSGGGATQSFATTVPQQNAYFTFSATAGDDLGFALTNLVFTPSTPNNVRIYIAAPGGGGTLVSGAYCYATTTPGCSFALLNVPTTGTYKVTVESMGLNTMTFDLTLSPDVTGALTFGTPLAVTLDSPGEQAWLSFTATASQNVVLTKTSIATTPSGKPITTIVYNAAGSQIANTTNNTINLNNLSAGTYQVLMLPADAATATLQVQVQ